MSDLESRLAKLERTFSEREEEHVGVSLRDLLDPNFKARYSRLWDVGEEESALARLVPNVDWSQVKPKPAPIKKRPAPPECTCSAGDPCLAHMLE